MYLTLFIKKTIQPILLLCIMLGTSINANGQVYNKTENDRTIVDNQKIISDTSGFAEKELDNSVEIYFKKEGGKKQWVDTSLTTFHKEHVGELWDVDLGNIGSASQSLKVTVDLPIYYRLTQSLNAFWKYTEQEQHYYNTTKAYTKIDYSAGSKKEQMIRLLHTQNITPLWNFSVQYRKLSSIGFYKGQKNNIDNFSLNSNYQSKNKKYKIYSFLAYDKLQQDENLGISDLSFLGNSDYNNRALIPVNSGAATYGSRSHIKNYNRGVVGSFKQEYAFGTSREVYNEDSVKNSVFTPRFYVGNEVYARANRYCFQHATPDSSFYNAYFDYGYLTSDTFNMRYDNFIVGSNFSIGTRVNIKQNEFNLQGGYGLEYQNALGDLAKSRTVNNYVFGRLYNQSVAANEWKLDAAIKLFFTGLPKGNLDFNALLAKKLSEQIGTLGFELKQVIAQPYYVSENIEANGVVSNKDFGSQANSSLGGFYQNDVLKLRISASSLLFNNLIYWDLATRQFAQNSTAISIQQIEARKDLVWRKWSTTHYLLGQVAPANQPIQVPLIASRHSFVYNDRIFKKKMEMAAGFDIYFNTPFFNDAYQPVFQNFAPQYGVKQSYIPRLAAFFNFKVKRFRAFVSADQMQHFLVPNNINYVYGYVSQNALFRLGLSWIFVN